MIIAFALSSCLSKVAIEIEESNKQIVVNSILCTADTATVNLSFTYPSFGERLQEVPLINKVIFSESINTFEMKERKKNNGRIQYIGNFIPQTGAYYQLSVEFDNNKTLTASCEIPEIVEIDSFYIKKAIPEYEGDMPIDLKIKFTDPADEVNFYLVGFTIYKSNQKYFFDPDENFTEPEHGFVFDGYHFMNKVDANMNINEPLIGDIEFNYPKILCFNDKKIDGSTYTLTIGIRDVFKDSFTEAFLFIPKLYSINADTYTYFQSINIASENNDSFITEPVMQYSNINGGIGILGAMAMASDTIMFLAMDFN